MTKLNFFIGPIGQDQQLLATLVSERSRVNQLEQALQTKEANLMSVLKELDSIKSSSSTTRERHSSMTSNDQEEIRNIFSDPENSADSDLMLQNQRLMYDLDKSIGERKMLSQQMENWKRQLTSTGKKAHALKKYDRFALNTSCFWGSTRSNIKPVVHFHDIFITKIIN